MVKDTLPEALVAWIPRQRWYAGKGRAAALTRLGGWSLTSADAEIVTHYVLDQQSSGTTLYQVPVSRRSAPLEGFAPIWQDETGYFYDAPHDAAYAAAVLGLIGTETETGGARGHRQPGARPVTVATSAVLTGEQSNTSIIVRAADGPPVILKVFRALHAGDNPDVILQSAISAAEPERSNPPRTSGSKLVPVSVGFLSGVWPDPRAEGGGEGDTVRGHLAFAQEFLEGAEDAWRTAVRAATEGQDFSVPARRLGVATAQLHATLATALPTREAQDADIARLLAAMRGRANSAIDTVPALTTHRAAIESALEAARYAKWPDLQRIHGDFHLGQVLGLGAEWVFVDFEGEPLRPMSERSELDLALRDVAGMLRSFDYVAGAVRHAGSTPAAEASGTSADPGTDPALWAENARAAFLAGYFESASERAESARGLLAALELDKALYEAVYEARNRPDWLGIPVGAIERLAGS